MRNGQHGHLTLIETDLRGGSGDHSAIVTEDQKVYLRDIQQNGYAHLLKGPSDQIVDGTSIDEWHALPGYSLFGAPLTTLRLPIEEAPDVSWESDFDKWIIIDATDDITQMLQKAIDEGVENGATTLCFTPGEKNTITGPIRMHGSINRIIGMTGLVNVADPRNVFRGNDAPAVFTFEDLDRDALVVERFFLLGGWNCPGYVTMFENKFGKAIVLKNMGLRGNTKKPEPGGTWFIEDVAPGASGLFQVAKGERVWARQFNPESGGAPMARVEGGQLWVLGLKTEGRGAHMIAENDTKVEVLGGVIYQSWANQPLDPPMFIIKDAEASFTLGFYHHDVPFATIVEETLNGETRALKRDEFEGYHLPVYRAGSGE